MSDSDSEGGERLGLEGILWGNLGEGDELEVDYLDKVLMYADVFPSGIANVVARTSNTIDCTPDHSWSTVCWALCSCSAVCPLSQHGLQQCCSNAISVDALMDGMFWKNGNAGKQHSTQLAGLLATLTCYICAAWNKVTRLGIAWCCHLPAGCYPAPGSSEQETWKLCTAGGSSVWNPLKQDCTNGHHSQLPTMLYSMAAEQVEVHPQRQHPCFNPVCRILLSWAAAQTSSLPP